MDDVTIWHNSACSKSCSALSLLQEKGVEPVIVDYRADPPTQAQFREILKRLGAGPRDVLRTNEPEYESLGLADATDDELIEAMCAHPILIQRPIVLRGDRAVVGRPPERILDVL